MKSHFVRSSVSVHLDGDFCLGIFRENEWYTHPPIPFQCRLSFHCCCYCCCCPWLEALQDAPCDSLAPCCSTVASVISVSCSKPRFSRSGASGGNNAEQLLLLPLPGSYFMLVALEAATLRPGGDVSCAEAPPLPGSLAA